MQHLYQSNKVQSEEIASEGLSFSLQVGVGLHHNFLNEEPVLLELSKSNLYVCNYM